MKTLLFALASMVLFEIHALGGVESVTLIKVLENFDQGIIERRNGEQWLVEKGIGAISFWRLEGKIILIDSPGGFCGIGSKVILPNEGQEAKIWKAEQIRNAGNLGDAVKAPPIDETQITATALVALGFFAPNDPKRERRDLVLAMKAFQKMAGIDQTGKITPASQLALSNTISAQKPVTEQSIKLASLLLDSAKRLIAHQPPSGGVAKQQIVNQIEAQIDGDFNGWEGETIVKLTNGQVWKQNQYYYNYRYAYMPKVTIFKAGASYAMLVNGLSRSVGVTQIK